MSHTINNRETNQGDKVHYVDHDGKMHDATIKDTLEENGSHFADLEFEKDGETTSVSKVPHNTSPERHSWNHTHEPLTHDELKRHGFEA